MVGGVASVKITHLFCWIVVLLGISSWFFSLGLTCWFNCWSFSLATSWFHHDSNCMLADAQTNALRFHRIQNVCYAVTSCLSQLAVLKEKHWHLDSIGLLLTLFSTEELCFGISCWKWGMWCMLFWKHIINIFLLLLLYYSYIGFR